MTLFRDSERQPNALKFMNCLCALNATVFRLGRALNGRFLRELEGELRKEDANRKVTHKVAHQVTRTK